jgi:hypothetical protein
MAFISKGSRIFLKLSKRGRVNLPAMKMAGVFLLITIAIAISAPFTPKITCAPGQSAEVLCMLDVCCSSGPSLSSDYEMPSLCECTCEICPSAFAGFHRAAEPQYTLFLIPDPKERPPRS